MMYGGDYDDAVNVVDVWLHTHPQQPLWEKDDLIDFDDWSDEPEWRRFKSQPEKDEEEEEFPALPIDYFSDRFSIV